METQTTTSLIILGERHFDHGYSCGRLWYFNPTVCFRFLELERGVS